MDDLSECTEGSIFVKIITGKTSEEVDKKAAEFEKQHIVIEVKQTVPTMMFLFYLG